MRHASAHMFRHSETQKMHTPFVLLVFASLATLYFGSFVRYASRTVVRFKKKTGIKDATSPQHWRTLSVGGVTLHSLHVHPTCCSSALPTILLLFGHLKPHLFQFPRISTVLRVPSLPSTSVPYSVRGSCSLAGSRLSTATLQLLRCMCSLECRELRPRFLLSAGYTSTNGCQYRLV